MAIFPVITAETDYCDLRNLKTIHWIHGKYQIGCSHFILYFYFTNFLESFVDVAVDRSHHTFFQNTSS